MIRKRIGAPCESGASVRCWHGGGKPTAAAWVSTGGWSNGRWRGCISFVGYECAGSGEPKSMRPSSTSDVYSSVGTTSKSFVRNSKSLFAVHFDRQRRNKPFEKSLTNTKHDLDYLISLAFADAIASREATGEMSYYRRWMFGDDSKPLISSYEKDEIDSVMNKLK